MTTRVLIVEDELIVAADLEIKLRRMGYDVVGIATSGEEAVELAEKENPNVILMDIQLQGVMFGTEAARRIQERAKIPVIFLTAFANVFVHDPQQMQFPGICISKPFSVPQLRGALEAAGLAP
jgi:CheY-like chemotaxis protein